MAARQIYVVKVTCATPYQWERPPILRAGEGLVLS